MARSMAKKAAKLLWGMTLPVRGPLRARFDARVEAVVANAVNARMMPPLIEALAISDCRLERIEVTMASANHAAATIAEEMDLVLDGLSRELFRLQGQVETLRAIVANDGRGHGTSPSILDDDSGDDSPTGRSMATERAMVG